MSKKINRHYYAFYHTYGIRMSRFDEEKYRELRIGYPLVFDSKSARDKWVDDDEFTNDWHREAISRADLIHEGYDPNGFEEGE